MTPEGLGTYLTGLVAEKNASYPADHAELLACGILATITALKQTAPGQMGPYQVWQGLAKVLYRLAHA